MLARTSSPASVIVKPKPLKAAVAATQVATQADIRTMALLESVQGARIHPDVMLMLQAVMAANAAAAQSSRGHWKASGERVRDLPAVRLLVGYCQWPLQKIKVN